VEIISQSLVAKGFSQGAANKMAAAQKASSRAVYEGKWQGFTDWCYKQGFDPLRATIPVIADFICHLQEDKDLAYSTLEGYRTAIGHVIKAVQGIDIGRDPQLASLFASLARTLPIRRSTVPAWNLALVLQALTEAPFEPLATAPFRELTLKTVFLVALASGKRRGELHALTRASFSHDENWTQVSIKAHLDFVAKTELVAKRVNVMKPVNIKAISTILDSTLTEDLTLCPVRALRIYLQRTDPFRTNQVKLFVSFKPGFHRDIAVNTISGWLKQTILQAYETSSGSTRQLFGVKAHQVRSLAASWAFLRNASLDSILEAGSWRSHNTFTHFYLKDLTHIQGEMLVLGPVVAASHTS
jgi:integrase